MNKYKEALRNLENYVIEKLREEDLSINHFTIEIEVLQQLIDEKLEQESRKDKLIVGSQWECVAKCLTPISSHYIDPILDRRTIAIQKSWVLTVLEIEKDYVKLQHENTKCFLSQDQFLLCFKPLKEGEQL